MQVLNSFSLDNIEIFDIRIWLCIFCIDCLGFASPLSDQTWVHCPGVAKSYHSSD